MLLIATVYCYKIIHTAD